MLQHLPFPRRTSRRILSWSLALVACTACAAVGDEPATRRRGGSTLDSPIDVSWNGLPLRQAAARLSELSGLPVVVDRRIDPDTRLSLDAFGEPLAEVLAKVAAAAGGSVAVLESHVRIATPEVARRLAAAERLRVAELRTLDGNSRKRVLERRGWRWPDGARPRDLVASAATEGGISIAGIDSLPHDHFPGAELPELTLAERLDLVLAHFDRRIEWKNRSRAADGPPTFAIVPIDAPDDRAKPAAIPKAGMKPRPAQARPPAEATYSLRVEAPLDELLATVSKRLGLTLELDRRGVEARGIAAGEIVRLNVENASRETLLDAILDPLGVGWQIDGTTLKVGHRR
jgi:hypothetical protein